MPYTIPAPAVPLFQGRANTAQTLGAAFAASPVALQVNDFDDANGHSTTSNTSRYVAARAGLHQVSGTALFNAGQATTAGTLLRVGYLTKNGTRIPTAAAWGAYAGAILSLSTPPVIVALAIGDYVELNALAGLASAQLTGDGVDASMLRVDFVR